MRFNLFCGLFIPHPHNNHKAKILHFRSLLVFCLLIISSQGGLLLVQKTRPNILGYATSISSTDIIQLSNIQRHNHGLSELRQNSQLARAAQEKARDMFARGYWAHNAPDGTQPWYFITNTGYNYLQAGENLARDFNNAPDVVTAWMNSDSHRKNLLSQNYHDIGVAVVNGELNGVSTTLVVQMFGSSRSSNPTTQTREPALVAQAYATDQTQYPSPTPTPIQSRISPHQVSQTISISITAVLVFTLLLDWFIVFRANIIRISGKNWAHVTFLITIIAIIIFAKPGLVL